MAAVLVIGGAGPRRVQDAPLPLTTATAVPAETNGTGMGHSSDCMTCHGMPNFTGTLGNGQVVNLSIDPAVAGTNLHTRLGECSVCHKDFDGYPPPQH